MSPVLADRVGRAIADGAEELFGRQRGDGAFTDDPPGSTLGTAGAITALHAADPQGSTALIDGGLTWLRARQLPDGGWGGVDGAPAETVATAVAVAALHRIAPAASSDAVTAGRGWLAAHGGVEAVTDPAVNHLCRQFLALAGLPEAGQLRRLPLEVVHSDAIRRRRISFRTAPFLALALLQHATAPPGTLRRITQRSAIPAALRLLQSIDAHEQHTGDFSEDPWPAALVCLGLTISGHLSEVAAGTAGFLRRSVRPDGGWDAVTNLDLTRSAFAATGLIAAGYATDPRLHTTRDLLHRTQQTSPFAVLGVPAGGWSYCCGHGWPVTLESAEILTALAGLPDAGTDPVLRSGLDWLIGRQDTRGSFSLWVRDTRLANDGPCPAITAQAITALCDAGHDTTSAPVTAAATWLFTQQNPDGTFENLWYRDHTSGTAMVLDALVHAGHTSHPAAGRARDWLLRTQLADGSWGPGDGTPGTVEETAWAVHALLSAGQPAGPGTPAARAVDWLIDAQTPGGGWPTARVCAYIRHHMHYPNGAITRALALRALAAFRRTQQAAA
ncbi:prenyltransferase/squalene oxidase repeat-containing protein [Actinoplanes derwentensis]|uniref:Squalene-hopene/tetraprenyl-beta-curcumene cyclase n=1 Tax=Actinoplanes derwentensis TaxID=113562 RepID=A0A1H1W8Y1_9ACTN|nr:prenyltransferase/squalene oxidase repeat-containing protein [Actinoplanes derwentensis]GID84092.1 squalene--hopene cyclase [Actinoplanes derwentensis]SDS93515.1 squalene-hopene/tetraprenyl-beta-curcumene cyclase [Actinoplanes derwentensis]